MMVYIALSINPIGKQLTSMSNPAIPHKLSRTFQDLFRKDYPVYLQQRIHLKNRKITMSSLYNNVHITKDQITKKKTMK